MCRDFLLRGLLLGLLPGRCNEEKVTSAWPQSKIPCAHQKVASALLSHCRTCAAPAPRAVPVPTVASVPGAVLLPTVAPVPHLRRAPFAFPAVRLLVLYSLSWNLAPRLLSFFLYFLILTSVIVRNLL